MADKPVMRVARADAEKLIQFCGYASTDILSNEKLAGKLNIYNDIQPNDKPPEDLAAQIQAALDHVAAGGVFDVFSPAPAEGEVPVAEAGAATAAAGEKPKRGRPRREKAPKAEKPPKPPKAPKSAKVEKDRKEGTAFIMGVMLRTLGTDIHYKDEAALAKYRAIVGGERKSSDDWYLATVINAIRGFQSTKTVEDMEKMYAEDAPAVVAPAEQPAANAEQPAEAAVATA